MVSVWKFVDRPEAVPTTLLDMNNGSTWRMLREDLDLSPPPLRRSIATNSMMDGGIVTSAFYELRELKFKLVLAGVSEDARAAQLDLLKVELSKPTNLIMHKAETATFPVFFRTFRSDNYSWDREELAPNAWLVTCSVLAEPFAIGTRHDIVTGTVVTNNPASGTNRLFFDITGVRGDHPSPAFARVGTGFGAGATFALGQRTLRNPTALTLFAQAEAATLGTDTTTQPNDAAMSGAGNNFTRTTFATNTLITRLTVTVPTATSSEALRGKYRVFVKVRRSAGTSAFLMRFNVPGTSAAPGMQVSYDTGLPNSVWMMDLGVVEFPSTGPAPTAPGYSGLTAGYAQPTLEIQAQRTSGALNLDIDYVYLMPADERFTTFRQLATMGYIVLDGPNDMVFGMAAGTSPFGANVSDRVIDNGGGLAPRGAGLPMLVPGVTNRWHVLRLNQDVTLSSTWDVSYWPYWLEVATS